MIIKSALGALFPDKWLFLIVVLELFCSIYFQSRAFTFALITSLALIILPKLSTTKKGRIKAIIISCICGLVFLLFLVFCVKTDSSEGRVLIYKISFSILKDYFPIGIGENNFSYIYGNYQAEYFKRGDFSQKELLLADNPSYAFNDYLQFVIQKGFIGLFIILILGVIIFYELLLGFNKSINKSQLLFIAIIHIFTLLFAAFFTHVFEKWYFQLVFIISLAILIYLNHTKIKKPVIIFSGILFFILIITQPYIYYFDSYKRFKYANSLFNSGFIDEANQITESLYNQLKEDPVYLDKYIDMQLSLGKYQAATKITSKLILLNNTGKANCKLAWCFFKNKQYAKAELSFKKAINLVPNRFYSREKLFDFYVTTHQYEKAIILGKEILLLPVKIPSKAVFRIKQKVKNEILILRINSKI